MAMVQTEANLPTLFRTFRAKPLSAINGPHPLLLPRAVAVDPPHRAAAALPANREVVEGVTKAPHVHAQLTRAVPPMNVVGHLMVG